MPIILPATPVHQPQAPLLIMSSSTNPCITDGKCASPTNIPEFIDTSACLCGLLPSKQEDPNGGYIELWRCLGNASDDLRRGTHGKWYNTTLPSQELVGINMPQNWGENGPDTSQAFVVVNDSNGKPVYQKVDDPNHAPNLTGPDADCNAKNDTELSTQFYSHSGGKGAANSASSSSASASASASSSSVASSSSSAVASSAASGTATASGTTPASTAGSSTSATASPSVSKTSDASYPSVKVLFVLCMLFAPLFASVA